MGKKFNFPGTALRAMTYSVLLAVVLFPYHLSPKSRKAGGEL
jgi:hypothetical protein